MNIYYPDNWVIVEVNSSHGQIRKVLAGWKGAFASPDAWRLSSGITEVDDQGDHYKIFNESGSLYVCQKHNEGFSPIILSEFEYMKTYFPTINATIERVSIEGVSKDKRSDVDDDIEEIWWHSIK